MEKEELIAKGVKCVFNGQATVFEVESLNEHYEGLRYHDSDIITVADGESVTEYIKASDLNFDAATAKEVKPVEEIDVKESEDISNTKIGTSFDIAELTILNIGGLAKLPEWEGFWFKNLKTGQLLVFTKDNEILDTPYDEYKLREDWVSAEATPDQKDLLALYFQSVDTVNLPEDINDVNNIPAETIEKVVEEVKKEDVSVAKLVAEANPKKSTNKK